MPHRLELSFNLLSSVLTGAFSGTLSIVSAVDTGNYLTPVIVFTTMGAAIAFMFTHITKSNNQHNEDLNKKVKDLEDDLDKKEKTIRELIEQNNKLSNSLSRVNAVLRATDGDTIEKSKITEAAS